MNSAEIPFVSIAELARMTAKKEVSPVETTSAYLDRIDALNGTLHPYVTVTRELAMQQARAAEGAMSIGKYLGPLHGIPIAVKDHLPVRGVKCTFGSALLAEEVAQEDCAMVERLKKAGAIIIGTTCLTEFAGGSFAYPTGIPRNPWDTTRTPGGSSSGSAVATAAFMCAGAVGSDGGGSIRMPASFCGIVGLRPTLGRISRYGVAGGTGANLVSGPMTRTVEDCALLLQTLAGHDPRDGYSSKAPVPDYSEALDGNIKGLRVGVVKEFLETKTTVAEVKNAARNASAVMAKLGAIVTEVSQPLLPYSGVISAPLVLEGAWRHDAAKARALSEKVGRRTRVQFLTSSIQAYFPELISKAYRLRALLIEQVNAVMQHVDVLVLPTCPSGAPKLNTDGSMTGTEEQIEYLSYPSWRSEDEVKSRLFGRSAYSTGFNIANLPAITLPCGFTSQNLPIGLQIAGRRMHEATVLKVADAYERNTNWHTRRPPLRGPSK